MSIEELSITLREMARQHGLCDEWYNQWSDDDSIDELLDKYVRGFDFCTNNNYPPLDFIRENFNKEDLNRHQIYVDETFDVFKATSGTYIFLGDCEGTLTSEFSVVNVFVRHNSKINIIATDFSKCFVSYFDDSSGNTYHSKDSTIKIYNRRKKEE